MWRSLFLALGIFSLILGAETLIVDKFIMSNGRLTKITTGPNGVNSRLPVQTNSNGVYYQQAGYQSYTAAAPQPPSLASRVVQTRDWMPWSLLATGAIIVLYTYSLPTGNRHED